MDPIHNHAQKKLDFKFLVLGERRNDLMKILQAAGAGPGGPTPLHISGKTLGLGRSHGEDGQPYEPVMHFLDFDLDRTTTEGRLDAVRQFKPCVILFYGEIDPDVLQDMAKVDALAHFVTTGIAPETLQNDLKMLVEKVSKGADIELW